MKNRFGKRRQFLPNLEARFPWFLVSTIVFIGAALRALLLYSTTLVPGMNGAYYLVQARALIERGKLGIPDLPLTFAVQAALAKIVQWISGASLETSIMFAVKCADTILPPLVAIPVFALVRQWSRRTGAGNWVPACAALAAAAGAPALMMVGDFQKNSLALVWLAALLWSLHQWLEQPSFKRAVLPVLFLALIGITHIGVFGWSLALTVPVIAIALWRSAPETRRAILPWLFVGGGACALAAGLVLWKYDPSRISKLANAAMHPIAYLQQNQRPGMPPNINGGRFGVPANMPNGFRPQFANAGGNFPATGATGFFNRFSNRSGWNLNWNWLPGAALLAASIGALAAVWFKRKTLPVSTLAVIGACGVVLFALCGPWVTGDKVMRFRLIAVGPALLCASFALLQLNLTRMRNALAGVMMLALVVPGILHASQGGRPVITTQAARELQSMSGSISQPEKTLIVARHGLEWWTAWYLHTHIAHENAVTAADWKHFNNVYFLHQKAGMQMPGGPMPGITGQPDFARVGFPPRGDANDRSFPPRGFAGPGPMGEPMIPDDADITHDGEFFTLALAPAPEALATKTNATYAQRL
jgi:hypothetical protein